MKVNTSHVLARTALDVVVERFRSSLSQPIQEEYISYSLDAPNSELVLTTLDYSSTGSVGRYIGEARVSYGKARLEQVLPYPLAYTASYPTTWRVLKAELWDTYGILLEDGEFSLDTAPTHGLTGDDVIATDPSVGNSLLYLTALSTSGRWATGTKLRLQVVGGFKQAHLNDMISLPFRPDMARITDGPSDDYYPN